MNSTSVTVSPTPGNLLDEFEEAYQNCLAPLIKEDPLTYVDMNQLKTNAEANTMHFIEMGRMMQAFFLQKRFQLAAQKPELVILEDVAELRGELTRKDELIKKQTEKLSEWQATIEALQNHPNLHGSSTSGAVSNTSTGLSGNTATTTPQQIPTTTHSSSLPGSTIPQPNAMSTTMGGGRSAMMTQQSSSMTMGHSPSQAQSPMGHMMSPGIQSGQQGMDGVVGRGGGHHMAGGSSPHMGPIAGGSSPHMGSMAGGNSPHMAGSMAGGTSPHMGSMAALNSPNSMMNTQQGGAGFSVGSSPMMMGGGGYGGGNAPYAGGSRSLPGAGLQGPLAYLEKTTTNIGML